MKHLLTLFLLLTLLPATALARDYTIGQGDRLFISVWGEQAMSGEALVRPDGKITVAGLGEFTAAGKTTSALQKDLDTALEGMLKYAPTVTVAVTEIKQGAVYVFGGGVPQGVFPLEPDTTLLHLLCSIEDTSRADLANAYLLRDNVSKVRQNFIPLFELGNMGQNIELKSGDKVFIPPLLSQFVYVVGEVEEPQAIEFREGMSVLEAILQAGGFTTYAAENDTLIVRSRGEKGQEELPVRVGDLVDKGDLSQDLPLQRGDYVIVKKSLF